MKQNSTSEKRSTNCKNPSNFGTDLERDLVYPQIFAASDLSAMRALVEKVFGPISTE
jgi:hypothetical protein